MDRSSFLSLMLSAGLISSAAPVMSYRNSFNTAIGDFHAFLLGVTTYGPQDDLKTDRDCKVLSTVLKKAGYKTAEIITGNLRVAALKEHLETFKNKAGENDTLLFFFAGHGTQDGSGNDVLSIYNGNSTEHLLVSDVVTTLMGSKAANVIFVFDCCRKSVDRAAGGKFTSRLASISRAKPNNILVIQACKPDERSFEVDGTEDEASGLFTRELVKFISTTNESNYVDGTGLARHFKSGITADSKTQTPTFAGSLNVVLCHGLGNIQPPPPPKPKKFVEVTFNKKPEEAEVKVNDKPANMLMKYELGEDEQEMSLQIAATASGYEDYEKTKYLGPGKHTVDIDMRSLLVGEWTGRYTFQFEVGTVNLVVNSNLKCQGSIIGSGGTDLIRFAFEQVGKYANGDEFQMGLGYGTIVGTVNDKRFDAKWTMRRIDGAIIQIPIVLRKQ